MSIVVRLGGFLIPPQTPEVAWMSLVGAWAVLAGAVGGCDRRELPPELGAAVASRGEDKGFIAFVAARDRDPIWPVLKTSAERQAAAFGDMEVRFYEPKGPSPQDQIDLINSLTDPRMRGVCVEITDAEALTPTLTQLYNRGPRIVSMLEPVPERLRVGHAGFDDAQIGEALAEATAVALDGEGSVMLLHAGYVDRTHGSRLIAFERKLKQYPQIALYAKIDSRGDPREARRIIRERSRRFPRLSAWVSLSDWPLRDVVVADDALPEGCRLITFGGTPGQWPLIREGVSPVIVGAHYGDLGAKALEFCEAAIRQPSRFVNRYAAPLRLVQPSNLDDYIRDWTFWSTGVTPKDALGVELGVARTPG